MNISYMIIAVEISESLNSITLSTAAVTVAAKNVARPTATVAASDGCTIVTNYHFADSFTESPGIIRAALIVLIDHPKRDDFGWTANTFSRSNLYHKP